MSHEYFIMRVIKIDGEIIGTGWTGKKIALPGDDKKLISSLKKLGVIPKGKRPKVEHHDLMFNGNTDEVHISWASETQLVLKYN